MSETHGEIHTSTYVVSPDSSTLDPEQVQDIASRMAGHLYDYMSTNDSTYKNLFDDLACTWPDIGAYVWREVIYTMRREVVKQRYIEGLEEDEDK